MRRVRKMKRMREMKGANDLKYVVFTARWWTVAAGRAVGVYAYVRVNHAEWKFIIRYLSRRRDSRLESRLTRLARRTIFRAAAIYATAKRVAPLMIKDVLLRSTAMLSAPRRRRRQGWRVTNASYNTRRFCIEQLWNARTKCVYYTVTNFPVHLLSHRDDKKILGFYIYMR